MDIVSIEVHKKSELKKMVKNKFEGYVNELDRNEGSVGNDDN